jgi:hypothetical protein
LSDVESGKPTEEYKIQWNKTIFMPVKYGFHRGSWWPRLIWIANVGLSQSWMIFRGISELIRPITDRLALLLLKLALGALISILTLWSLSILSHASSLQRNSGVTSGSNILSNTAMFMRAAVRVYSSVWYWTDPWNSPPSGLTLSQPIVSDGEGPPKSAWKNWRQQMLRLKPALSQTRQNQELLCVFKK